MGQKFCQNYSVEKRYLESFKEPEICIQNTFHIEVKTWSVISNVFVPVGNGIVQTVMEPLTDGTHHLELCTRLG